MNFEDSILIERFFNDDLTTLEKESFFKRMKNDAEFKEFVLIEKQLFETLSEDKWSFAKHINQEELEDYVQLLKSDKTQNLKSILEDAKTSHNTKPGNINKQKKWFLYIAASLVICLSLIPVLTSTRPSPEKLYATYLNTAELPSLVDRENSNDITAKAQHYFEDKNYSEALSLFNSNLNLSSNQKATVYLYVGISYMELEQYSNAENTFDALISSNLMDATKGYWFKALLKLKTGQVKEAKPLLENIVKNNWFNHRKASQLLEEL